MKLCECGCGQEVKNRFIRGHFARVHHPLKNVGHTIESRRKISKTRKKRIKNGFIKIHNKDKKFPGKMTGEYIYCKQCNKQFYTQKNELKKGRKFCSMRCCHLSSLGHEVTNDTIRKISITRTGKCKGDDNPAKRPEVRRKISASQQGIDVKDWKEFLSKNSYNENFNKELREKIRERDRYKCQECFRHQNELFTKDKNKLSVHHIDYDKENSNPDNLISLCKSCHQKTNFKRKNWEEYFKCKIKEKKL